MHKINLINLFILCMQFVRMTKLHFACIIYSYTFINPYLILLNIDFMELKNVKLESQK